MRILLVVALIVSACSGKRERDNAAPPVVAPAVAAAADQQFWTWFVVNAAALEQSGLTAATINTIGAELAKTHAGVTAEIDGGTTPWTLVLTANGVRDVFPVVERLYAARPASIPGWNVIAFRQPAAPGDLGRSVEMAGKRLDPLALRFVAKPDGDKIGIDLYVPGYTVDDQVMAQLSFLALDHAIGEYTMETRVGVINLLPLDRAPARARPFDELPAAVRGTGK